MKEKIRWKMVFYIMFPSARAFSNFLFGVVLASCGMFGTYSQLISRQLVLCFSWYCLNEWIKEKEYEKK